MKFKKFSKLDVYEDIDQDNRAQKLEKRRGGGGGEVGRTMDSFESLDFQVEKNEDDSEIDEDEAFNEEDEKKYGAYFEKKLSDEESEDIDEEDGEYVDLSSMLDAPKPSASVSLLPLALESEEEQDSDLEAVMEDESDVECSDNENESTKEHPNLDSLIAELDNATQSKKRKVITEVNEFVEESEFGLAGKTNNTKKIGLEDLIAPVDLQSNFGNLKKQLSKLNSNESTATIGAPLPIRSQERISRTVAYEESKKSIAKWIPLVKKNREADHLQFPMDEPAPQNLTSGSLVQKFHPSTEMEMEIEHILDQSGLTEHKQKQREELELSKISPEEMKEKMAQLSKMRSLMFYQEQKLKKIAKIKSKTYRKIHKKSAEKLKSEIMKQMEELDPELAQEARDKAEFERIKERMTLKHKNTSKW